MGEQWFPQNSWPAMAILDENYAAKKYYKYDEYGKEVEKGATDFINDNTFAGAVSQGGNL